MDTQTELAKERNRISADRTLLTWVRTSISFIGMGFGISQILNFLQARNQLPFRHAIDPDVFGLVVIGLGVVITIAAALDYQGELRRLHHESYLYRSRPSLGLVVGGAVVLLSIVTLVLVWNDPPLS